MTTKKSQFSDVHPNQLLTPTECMQLFCERLRISRATYYRQFRPDIKFQKFGKKLNRIPYRIAVGLLNKLSGNPLPGDPSNEELQNFTK
jgi:hypothetical protein